MPTDRAQNLKPWPKGVSGNPGGRPKRKPITEACQAYADRKLPEGLRSFKVGRCRITLDPGATYADLAVLGQFISASKGNTAALSEIADRIEGKVPKPVELDVNLSVAGRVEQARAGVLAARKAEAIDAEVLTPEIEKTNGPLPGAEGGMP